MHPKTPMQDVRSIFGRKTVKSLKVADMKYWQDKVYLIHLSDWPILEDKLKDFISVLFWVTNLYIDPARYIHIEQTE